uniref:protein-glutamine gamma-glutamyltransferase 6 n=1 Tax=Scatophagus argus TaxID=75038 RepID=UPI001ED856A1|nr:protein-glutamine gamma-glutamyltransferase 6 [Scatophagus argus]
MAGHIYSEVDFHSKTNNTEHHTSAISVDQLIVRRGQPFKLTLKLNQPFNPVFHPLSFTVVTGSHPSEERGTMSHFGVPDRVDRSPLAKAVWKAEQERSYSLLSSILNLTITPPADAPIGMYNLSVTHGNEKRLLGTLLVLFNPWCPGDWVFLSDEEQRQEYVMNDQGIIYKGSGNYIFPMNWDYGQFEESMVEICMKILDLNHKHKRDPADDVSARCNPIYVSRVVSAMINSNDDRGVVQGRWSTPYTGGVAPTHWNGSHAILTQWLRRGCYPVKYGQCWVFAGVMCSVMRLLGIPCRVITNFQSAHDNNRNLIIDVYHADYGVRPKPSPDSIWNYHVWVEGWMRRPDLTVDGKYDGWQVLDPTPQERSDGVFCCGPAPVKAILDGETHLKYDVPFVFAEVNADCVDWLVKADGSHVKIWSDTKRVGQNISTKSVGSNKRLNITDTYKHREGTEEERSVFKYACTRDYSKLAYYDDVEVNVANAGMPHSDVNEESVDNEETEEPVNNEETGGNAANEENVDSTPQVPQITMRFEEVSKPMNGKDVSLKLVLHSKSAVAMQLSINISVQAMRYNGTPAANIKSEVKEETLQPGKDLFIPVLVPFLVYHEHIVDRESMKISAVVMDKLNPVNTCLAVNDVVLLDPPISVKVFGPVRVNRETYGEVVFMNPAQETLKNCSLTFSGSGLWEKDMEYKFADLRPNSRITIKFTFAPYKTGKKTLTIGFNCSTFRDIKGWCLVDVEP